MAVVSIWMEVRQIDTPGHAGHGDATLAGYQYAMGLSYGGVLLGARDWIGVMELICGGEPWTLTRSGRWDWFMWARNGARATLIGSGRWDWFMGTCQMTKYYTVREITKSSSTFSVTNISSNMIWFCEMHDTIKKKSNHTGINLNHNNITIWSHIMV